MKTLLIGDNAFIGVSHLSQDRARNKLRTLSVGDMVSVIEKALSLGASGYTFSTHPTNYEILKVMKNAGPKSTFTLNPVMPYAEGYVRIANEKGMGGILTEMMSRLTTTAKAKALFQGGLSALSMDPVKMLRAYVDIELEGYLNVKPDNAQLGCVFLHEVISDLSLSFKLERLFRAFTEHVHDKFGVKAGFVTRNFAKFTEFFQTLDVEGNKCVIMTPLNAAGSQMIPSKESCEAALTRIGDVEIIAMSPLAAGYLHVAEALEYFKSLPKITGVAVGVSTLEHAEDTFTKFRSLLSG